ncbi:MAG: Uncharacterized protein G01um10145_967 [Microgenomates group bacterium Gr01-1014_5]|nr:MAG: Uncharacterized protein G01um10145_967 [Microgenomates group bacterium Gr01-1014_5]
MGSVSAPQGSSDWQIKITGVVVKETGTNTSQSFNPNKILSTASLIGGPRITVPIEDFIQQTTKTKTSETSFSIQTTKTISYSEGNPNDPGGKLTQKETSCSTVSQQSMKVQAQQQQQPAPQPNPGNPVPAPGAGRGRGPIYCDPPANTQINTAIGCIPVNDTNAFAGWFLGWAIGVSGGLALLLIVFSGFQIMTASGDPQKLQSGRELLTSAISGLILIIFSIFLLRLIGVQILNIPGLR